MSSVKGKLANNDAQVQDVTVTDTNGKTALDVSVVNAGVEAEKTNELLSAKLVKVEFDDVEITAKNGAGAPTTILYRNAGSLVATVTVTYDVDGDLQRVQVS